MSLEVATILRDLPVALVVLAGTMLIAQITVAQSNSAQVEASETRERDRSKIPNEFKWDLTPI